MKATQDYMARVALRAGYLKLQRHTQTLIRFAFLLRIKALQTYVTCKPALTVLFQTNYITGSHTPPSLVAVNFNSKFIPNPTAVTFCFKSQQHAMPPRGYPSEYWPRPLLLLNCSVLSAWNKLSGWQPLANAHTQLDPAMCNAVFQSRFPTKISSKSSSLLCEPRVQPKWSFPGSLLTYLLHGAESFLRS